MNQNNSSWTEWSQFVLKELERLNESFVSLQKDFGDMKVEVGKLQVKASIWGGVTGLITTLIALAMYILRNV